MRLLALCGALVASTRLSAQAVAGSAAGASTPEALAELVMRTFSSGTPEEFARVYPDSAGRVFMREARGTRQTELAQVIWKGPHRAVLLLGGVVKTVASAVRSAGVGSNETNGARHFSGFYEAVDSGGTWKLTRQIPLDSANFVRSQALHVNVTPATGLQVLDSVGIVVGASYGFGVRLNNAAQLHEVSIDGKPVEHAFGGGVLWLKAPKKAHSLVVLSYDLAATRAARPAADSDSATPAYRCVQQHRRVASVLRLSQPERSRADHRHRADSR